MRQRGPALDGALELDEFAHASVSAVDRALVLLEARADAPDGLTVSGLSARLRINKGLTHRILSSLVGRDYVVKDERTQHYRLTIRLIGLAFRHLRVLDVYDVILPILRRLAQETGELAELNRVEQGGSHRRQGRQPSPAPRRQLPGPGLATTSGAQTGRIRGRPLIG